MRASNRHWLLGLHCLVALALACGGFDAPAATVVKVGIYENPPKVTAPPNAPAGGIFVDVLEDVARKEGFALQYVPGSFQEGLERVRRGEIQLMVDVARTPERERSFDLNREAVLQSWSSVYARSGSGIRNLLQLSGRRVAVLAGGVQEKLFRDAAASFGVTAVVVPFDTYDQAFAAVARGEAEAVLANPFYGQISRSGLEDTAIIFGPTTLHFATMKGANGELLAAIDRDLAQLKADPTSSYFASFERLLGTQRVMRIPAWVSWAAGAAALVLVLAAGWIYTARRAAARYRAAEASQRRLAEGLRRIFDNSLDVICVLSADLCFLRVSPACRRWGYVPAELEGRSCLLVVEPARRAAFEANLRAAMAGRPLASLAGRVLRKDGSAAVVTWSAAWSAEQQEMYCIGHDESERMVLLDTLEQHNLALERANQDLQIVSYSLSHDLRAPTAAIVGFVGKVLGSLEHGSAGDNPRLLARSVAAAQRIDAMVRDLAAMLQVAGESLRPGDCDVSRLACEIVDAATAERPEQPRVSIAGGMRAQADARLVRVALENLIANAWKFSARAQAPSIEVGCSLDEHAGQVYFVRDNGVGFDMEHESALYRPFSRLHAHAGFAGTGMGLTIAQRAIARHGGRLWARSAPGAGATFYFTLSPDASQRHEP